MRSRLLRRAFMTVGVLGLTATPAPPARADTVWTGSIIANATVTGGIGYPVLTLPMPEVPNERCLPLPPNSVLGIAESLTGETSNCHWVFDHQRSVTIASIVCEGVGANVAKDPLPPVSGLFCGFAGGGTITGHCGLNGGQVTVEFTDRHNRYILHLHFRTAFLMFVSGHWTNDLGQHGKVFAILDESPIHSPPPGPNCTTKTQEDFLWSGVLDLYSDPNL